MVAVNKSTVPVGRGHIGGAHECLASIPRPEVFDIRPVNRGAGTHRAADGGIRPVADVVHAGTLVAESSPTTWRFVEPLTLQTVEPPCELNRLVQSDVTAPG